MFLPLYATISRRIPLACQRVIYEFCHTNADREMQPRIDDLVFWHNTIAYVCIVNQNTVIKVANSEKAIHAFVVGLYCLAVGLGLAFLVGILPCCSCLVGNTRVSQLSESNAFNGWVNFGEVAVAAIPSCTILSYALDAASGIVILVDV